MASDSDIQTLQYTANSLPRCLILSCQLWSKI